MPRADRASQFMPFAALKGFEDTLREKERIEVPQIILTEETLEYLDHQLSILKVGDMVTIVYYDSGCYIKKTGLISRIKTDARYLTVVTTDISFDSIKEIRC
ncbi:YolD-like family protein [Butyrivibrio sp. YAB3001]|uniref:YolD-like family protein n=1 Tax=Butyrivibrio sp. YAB3001 TaxID=1520812 RepID=UPI0008F671AD|nr:YolD-like family protein [Butyrivibrio sp. YAB3001]SFD09063.1 YolD-like protein [Butyrivibrio sp. YAB3001]